MPLASLADDTLIYTPAPEVVRLDSQSTILLANRLASRKCRCAADAADAAQEALVSLCLAGHSAVELPLFISAVNCAVAQLFRKSYRRARLADAVRPDSLDGSGVLDDLAEDEALAVARDLAGSIDTSDRRRKSEGLAIARRRFAVWAAE